MFEKFVIGIVPDFDTVVTLANPNLFVTTAAGVSKAKFDFLSLLIVRFDDRLCDLDAVGVTVVIDRPRFSIPT